MRELPSSGAELPFATVVVPVLDEMRHLPSCLDALLGGDYPGHRMEVLVVDGGSTDGTREYVSRRARRDERLRLIDNPARTTPAGLNVGLREARGDVIVRMDGHAIAAGNYVSACVAALERTGAQMVGGHLIGRGETRFGRAVALATSTKMGAGDARYRLGGEGPTDTVYLGAWHKSIFDEIGPFDEGLVRNQDYELCLRIREAGGTVWLDPSIRSETLLRPGPLALARQYFQYGSGRAATLARHPGSLRLRQAVPAALALFTCTALPASLLVRRLRPLVAAVLALYGAAVALSTARLVRRHGRAYAQDLPLAFAVMHLAWGLGFWRGWLASRGSHHPNGGRGGSRP